MADYDAIVIGAGLGGLSAGALLSKGGRKTLVVDQSPRIGGYCSTLESDGFRFDAGASIIMIPEIIDLCFQRLGTSLENEVELIPLDPIYTIALKDGTKIRYPVSKDEYAEEIKKIAPGDVEGWYRYAEYMEGFLSTALKGFFLSPANTYSDMARMLIKTPSLLGYIPLFVKSYQQVMSSYFKDPRIQESLSFQASFMGLPPELCPGHMTMLPWAEHKGFYYSKGGMIALPEALARIGKGFGMEVRTDTLVKKVIVKDKRAVGVVLGDGAEITTDLVISNINAKALYLDLIGEEHLGFMARTGIKSMEPSVAAPLLLLGVDYEPPLDSHHTLCTLPVEELNSNYWNVIKKNELPKEQFGLISWTTFSDRGLAPKGNHILVMTLTGPNRLRDRSWRDVKQSLIDEYIDYMSERYVPELKNHVKVAKMITPEDYEKDLLAPEGSIYMFQQDVSNTTVYRPASKSKGIKGLYLVGASTHPGGGLPSVIASGMIAEDLIGKYEG
ncbi:MAG: phytoene desaturase [Deltaproteobacteria bacterium]|uniref:Phytoene desaturase n=1 Tax=Candidatus Zymogenus saltonus TaxID=2844893 RepID=A0A9D8KEL4_9DELT|nr:phytoene desaturase [Candidatus Zymogenus saltonus]